MKSQLTQIWQKFKKSKINIVLFFLIFLIILLTIVYLKNSTNFISYNDYQKLLDRDLIQKAHIEGDKLFIVYDGKKYAILKDVVDLKELSNHILITKSDDNQIMPFIIEISVIMVFFFILIYYFESVLSKRKKEQIKNLEKMQEVLKNGEINDLRPTISNVKFSDVAGVSEIKNELFEIVDFLKNPTKYKNFGIKLPKGVLMVGAPGVGKTLIAKAVAGEAGVPFFYQSGATFAEIYVGLGAKRVRELFAKAKANAPSIIFIDEIDAVGKSRGDGRNDEREATLNQLLTEMDGFEDNSGVIVIAATNKIEMIDEALLRSGRFDRRVFINLPNFADRVEILKTHLKNKNYDANLEKISRMSVGFSGAALATLVNEAAIESFRRGSEVIEFTDFENVKSKVMFGSKKAKILSEYEKQIQSFYQAAKALSAFWYYIEFDKIELLEDKFIKNDAEIESKTQILNQIKVLLSGACALRIYKRDSFTNGSNDIKMAIYMAKKLIFDDVMGDDFIANPDEVRTILNNCFDEVGEVIKNANDKLNKIAEMIFDNEYISFTQVKEIFDIKDSEQIKTKNELF